MNPCKLACGCGNCILWVEFMTLVVPGGTCRYAFASAFMACLWWAVGVLA